MLCHGAWLFTTGLVLRIEHLICTYHSSTIGLGFNEMNCILSEYVFWREL